MESSCFCERNRRPRRLCNGREEVGAGCRHCFVLLALRCKLETALRQKFLSPFCLSHIPSTFCCFLVGCSEDRAYEAG
jgi:hypothetical protein